jgi:hypothetical protein
VILGDLVVILGIFLGNLGAYGLEMVRIWVLRPILCKTSVCAGKQPNNILYGAI